MRSRIRCLVLDPTLNEGPKRSRQLGKCKIADTLGWNLEEHYRRGKVCDTIILGTSIMLERGSTCVFRAAKFRVRLFLHELKKNLFHLQSWEI